MDLKKEIKLSDLVRRPARAKAPGTRTFPQTETQSKGKRRLSRKAKQEMIGLKIGASQLAASRISNNGSPTLLQLVREPLEAGIVSRGEVRDIPALAAALDAFFTKYSLPRRNVRLGVATNRIGVRAFEMAGVDDDRQLSNAVRFRAQEAVAIPADEAVLDYHVVNETVDESGAVNRRIVLAAAYRESIDGYIAACKDAHIALIGIDLEAFALLRAVAPPPSEADERRAATIAVTIGHDRTTLAISDGVVCEFTRVVEWGGSALTTAIERSLHVSTEEAEELKLAITFDTDPSDDDDRTRLGREAVRREVQTLARELVSSLQFYQSQPESLAIGDVLIAGGVTRMPGFLEELARVTRVRVRRADPLARVAVSDDVEAGEDLPSYAVAIGLGVDD
jgi:type IV pilus assembly protein PilM